MADTASSSSPAYTTAERSDSPTRPSTPPSSPPGFPWEQAAPKDEHSDEQTSRDAFTLLRKRKALTPVSLDRRPLKRVATSKSDPKPLTQMQISLGQQIQKTCTQCGMQYMSCAVEDRNLHERYHKDFVEGCDMGKDFVRLARPGTTFTVPDTKDVICAVDHLDRVSRKKKAQLVLDRVEKELGAVPLAKERTWAGPGKWKGGIDHERNGTPAFTAYLYIRGTRCVGFVLTERIMTSKHVLPPSEPTKPTFPQEASRGTALAAVRARAQRRAAVCDAKVTQYPLNISKDECRATLGISRIWTLPKARHQGVACKLLDHVLRYESVRQSQERCEALHSKAESGTEDEAKRLHPNTGHVLHKTDIAFGQPTEAGARLARRWFGQLYGWKVYCD